MAGLNVRSAEVMALPKSGNVFIDRVSRALFYAGAMLLLAFIAWAQIAPLGDTNPSWWDADMARAASIGLAMMAFAFLGVILGGVWGFVADE